MKKKLIPLVWDNKGEWNTPPGKFGSVYGYAPGFNPGLDYIKIKRPVDDPVESERLYKENHNPERANKEWKWLDDLCSKVYKNYCKLWGV